MADQCCKTCKWFDKGEGKRLHRCAFPVENYPLPASVRDRLIHKTYVTTDMGKDCRTYKTKEVQ